MKIIKYITFITGMLCCLNSCRDYVEIEPEGNSRVLKYTSDYRGLANDYGTLENVGGMYIIADDDTEFNEDYQTKISDIWSNCYTWQPTIFNESQGDSDWINLYKTIYHANVMIDGVMSSQKGTTAEKEEIIAEAYVHRAFSYLQLVNIYGPQYNGTLSANEKAVPLLLTPSLYSSLERATVNEVYNQIIADLSNALSYNIQDLPEFNTLPSKAAVYAILARTYLYMSEYGLALESAENALDLQSSLIDLGAIRSNPYGYPVLLDNPEIIFSKKILYGYNGAPISEDLLNSFEEHDARYDVYTASGTNFYPTFTGRGYGVNVYSYSNGINVGVSVPEMYLIAAECHARLADGDLNIALQDLNTVRAKRFDAGSDFMLSANTKQEALDLVLEERRKEFVGRGLRWFDQKRLNLEDRYKKTITRDFKGTTYTLEPGSEGYVFPIFQNYIDLNPELGD
ncbi:RagB/SusD family nutrient uptake outer membrane protein [Confluentibacter sediminis]|uniref:RagB/SusD family nutrient uptake outer membrane protein n=1 Tax=Confluentibacter sediminis TaxID=2219045 RepID=UPI000DAB6E83|nr:RagB/SusD family nutrient uptake outer membrane protein [Confluentibacter sediminis]